MACRTLSAELHGIVTSLDPTIADLKQKWHGEASDAFQRTSARFDPTMADYAKQLDDAAAALDNVAEAIEHAQEQARNFQIMIGIMVGAGIALTVVSLGTSDLVAVAALEAEAGVVATVVAFASDALAAAAAVLARFALGMGFSALATVTVKGLSGDNVLDPGSYSADDATNILLGGVLTGGMGALARAPAIAAFLTAHPVLGAGAAGVVGGTSGSTIGQLWLNHASLADPDTLKAIGMSAAFAGASGLAVGGGQLGLIKLTGKGGGGSDRAVSGGDIARGFTGVPAGAGQYAVTFPAQPSVTSPATPTQGPAVTAPPPNVVASHGDSLWNIAKKRYGDGRKYKLIAEANHIEDPDRISVEQNLVVPADPTPTN